MNFVQHKSDFDENVIADLIKSDQNKFHQVLNINENNFDLDENVIADLIRSDQNMSNQDLNLNEIDFDLYQDFILDSQHFETEQFDDKGFSHNRTFSHNESMMDSTYHHPHQTNVEQQTFTKYVKHTIPDELKNLILETNRVWGVKFINDNQIVVDNHIFNMKTKVVNKQEGRFIKWTCANERCRFSLVTVEGRIKTHSRLHQHMSNDMISSMIWRPWL